MANIITLTILLIIPSIRSSCPSSSIIEPCSCVKSIYSRVNSTYRYREHLFNETQGQSIVCEHLPSSFPLRLVFLRLTSYVQSTNDINATIYDTFLLYNTSITDLVENLFTTITFRRLIFDYNPLLSTIDEKALTSTAKYIESIESHHCNLSNPFPMFRQLPNLTYIYFQDNNIRSIPTRAFNHSFLRRIWFGFEYSYPQDPIETIGDYAFYDLPQLYSIRLFSSKLSQISKYAFAQRRKSFEDDSLFELHLGGPLLHSKSFPLTSLTRFRHRQVYLRLYQTSFTYLDENVFQPFLETNGYSSVDLNGENHLFKCYCESMWIQRDYFQSWDQMDNRVYGYPCWDYDFSRSCARHR